MTNRVPIPDELAEWMAQRRWFRSKTRARKGIEVIDRIAVNHVDVLFVRVDFADGGDEVYVVPLTEGTRTTLDHSVVRREASTAIYDALATGELADALALAIRERRTFGDERSKLVARAFDVDLEALPAARVGTAEQTNTAVIFGDRLIMKVYRVTVEGENPEVEILRFLANKPVPTPRLAGEIEWVRSGHQPAAVALLSTFVTSKGDAWSVTLDALRALLAGETTLDAESKRAALLGRRTAELHRALASDPSEPAFAPEPMRNRDALVKHARESLDRTIEKLRAHSSRPLTQQAAQAAGSNDGVARLIAAAPRLRARLDEVAGMDLRSMRIRVHGDYHLGQVLVTPSDDFVIIDFEGEPARTLAERREKSPPLRDVAGMLRSFDYAAVTALREATIDDRNRATIDEWRAATSSAFVGAWREGVEGSAAAPASEREQRALLDLFLLDKAVYEVGYELDNRPAWLPIPVEGLLSLVP